MSSTTTASARAEPDLFLTAYDPSDLPGSSMDPMGFERGYLFLADKILPGLTNAGSRPRYLSLLCAGAHLAQMDLADSPRDQYTKRLECILRLERLWALGNVLASWADGEEGLPLLGIRGVRYAEPKARFLLEHRSKKTDANFPLLSRQVPYGAVGIYGVVAEGMRLLDHLTFQLTPDLGERLAEAFIHETAMPKVLEKAVREGSEVSLNKLTEWGYKAHVNAETGSEEGRCFAEALHQNSVRSRTAELLKKHPPNGKESELERIRLVAQSLKHDTANVDLREAMQTILAYEDCFRLAQLGLERLLWLCRTLPAGCVAEHDLAKDSVMELILARLPDASARLSKALDTATSEVFLHEHERLDDVKSFLVEQAARCTNPWSLADAIMDRHAAVQRGKFDRGRRKMPWLEVTAGRIGLTITRVGGLNVEATRPERIVPHPYRLQSADQLIAAAHEH